MSYVVSGETLKTPPSWEFDGTNKIDKLINTLLFSLLKYVGKHNNMCKSLKIFK